MEYLSLIIIVSTFLMISSDLFYQSSKENSGITFPEVTLQSLALANTQLNRMGEIKRTITNTVKRFTIKAIVKAEKVFNH